MAAISRATATLAKIRSRDSCSMSSWISRSKRNQMPDRTQDAFAIAKHEEQCEQQNEQVHQKGEHIPHHGPMLEAKNDATPFRALTQRRRSSRSPARIRAGGAARSRGNPGRARAIGAQVFSHARAGFDRLARRVQHHQSAPARSAETSRPACRKPPPRLAKTAVSSCR